MAENLELKAKVKNLRQCESVARSIGATFLESLHQVDTYFETAFGRLKLRVINSVAGELISYNRDESQTYRLSRYHRFDTNDPQGLLRVLTESLETKVIVEKKRSVWLYNNVRIHLDDVKNLGLFIEFEIPLSLESDNSKVLMDRLVNHFSLHKADIILYSYSDMLLRTQADCL
jgi:predicted adenylyl cyclase CyaB